MPKICYFSEICKRFEAKMTEIGQFLTRQIRITNYLADALRTQGEIVTHCFFSTKKKACKKKSIGGRVFLKEKLKIFIKKQQLPSKKALPARLSSEARNSA